jgi:hypothetical protein
MWSTDNPVQPWDVLLARICEFDALRRKVRPVVLVGGVGARVLTGCVVAGVVCETVFTDDGIL